MPKIIENCREKLLDEARRQINECGYGALTIRGVASACGVGVGTVYNYFSSKDALVATFMLEDWQAATADMHKAFGSGMPMEILSAEYDGLVSFAARHRALFMDPAAIAAFSV
ncbi:MAG: TetR/AcrR family transcriptional regulator, partial [Clostridia bacterium]|nr:TetR/AcrR family transcriptional regulator [Clostridia bacterium]